MRNILLLSKEVLRKDFLGCYNGKTTSTPNIDLLAKKGTIFTAYYSAAPSTAMAVTCMFTGLNAYQLDRKTYTEVPTFRGPTLFSEIEKKGYKTHVIWSESSMKFTYKYSKIFSSDTSFHFIPTWPALSSSQQQIVRDTSLKNLRIESYLEELLKIFSSHDHPVFVWMHCPHILSPRTAIGTDLDLFDQMVAAINRDFDVSAFITADHGTMLGEKGIFGYGYHVYEPAVNIPLITPYIGQHVVSSPVSSVQLPRIILEGNLTSTEFLFSDTAYYEQPQRKLMIRRGRFKYIYNKIDRSEELYDLDADPNENVNLTRDRYWEYGRKEFLQLQHICPYAGWSEAKTNLVWFRSKKKEIWREGTPLFELFRKLRQLLIMALPPRVTLGIRRVVGYRS